MKNKGQLVIMIVIVVFMILMVVQPWNLFKKDDSAASVSANAVSDNEASTEGSQDQTQQPAQQTTPASDLPPHTPANLYDIEDSDYISNGETAGSTQTTQQTSQTSGQGNTSSGSVSESPEGDTEESAE